MSGKILITTKGIKSQLTKLQFTGKQFYRSIAEFIWNGFDAQATKVELIYEFNEGFEFNKTALLRKLVIKDNGYGINHEKLKNKFEPIFESEKLKNGVVERNISTLHGRNGVGRFTFFTFAQVAKWTTIYEKDNENFKFNIQISANNLELFSGIDETPEKTEEPAGTIVSFSGFHKSLIDENLIKNEMINYLRKEFCWFLELKKSKGYKLLINGQEIDYSDILADEKDFEIKHEASEEIFKVRYIRWTNLLNDEYSKFYYLDEGNNEIHKETTTLNKQGDDFHHSLFVSSKFFKDFIFNPKEKKSKEKSSQINLAGKVSSDEVFRYLMEELYNFLRIKRKPFLKENSKKIIEDLKKEGIIVTKTKNDLENIQNEYLGDVIKEIYVTQPKIFSSLNNEQKRTMVGLLKLVLDTDERERVIEIVEQIVKLDPNEREDLRNLLKVTTMTKIIKTIKLVKGRYETLKLLEQILFNPELNANEVDHLQRIVENHTWIFGEQYNLVAAAEDDFEKALKNHVNILTNKVEDVSIDNPDKKKQVDIFICRQDKRQNTVHNIIIELKHPKKSLSESHLSQVKNYMRIILKEPRFNAYGYTWDFILVGNTFDSSGFIENEIKSNQRKGEDGLVQDVNNYKIFVRKWSDILIDCGFRHKFLDEKLQLEKNKLVEELKSADDAVELALNNIAIIK